MRRGSASPRAPPSSPSSSSSSSSKPGESGIGLLAEAKRLYKSVNKSDKAKASAVGPSKKKYSSSSSLSSSKSDDVTDGLGARVNRGYKAMRAGLQAKTVKAIYYPPKKKYTSSSSSSSQPDAEVSVGRIAKAKRTPKAPRERRQGKAEESVVVPSKRKYSSSSSSSSSEPGDVVTVGRIAKALRGLEALEERHKVEAEESVFVPSKRKCSSSSSSSSSSSQPDDEVSVGRIAKAKRALKALSKRRQENASVASTQLGASGAQQVAREAAVDSPGGDAVRRVGTIAAQEDASQFASALPQTAGMAPPRSGSRIRGAGHPGWIVPQTAGVTNPRAKSGPRTRGGPRPRSTSGLRRPTVVNSQASMLYPNEPLACPPQQFFHNQSAAVAHPTGKVLRRIQPIPVPGGCTKFAPGFTPPAAGGAPQPAAPPPPSPTPSQTPSLTPPSPSPSPSPSSSPSPSPLSSPSPSPSPSPPPAPNKRLNDPDWDLVTVNGTQIVDKRDVLLITLGEQIYEHGRRSLCKAHDNMANQPVIVKIIRKVLTDIDGNESSFVMDEFYVGKYLEHPAFMRTFAAYQTSHAYYLVLEYIHGRTLHDAINDPTVSMTRKKAYFVQMVEAIRYMHGKGVIYRDLKPTNVMITQTRNGKERIKFVDYGISTRLGKRVADSSGEFIERRKVRCKFHPCAYMAPEMYFFGKQKRPCDIYQLAFVAYILFTADLPFHNKPNPLTQVLHTKAGIDRTRQDWRGLSADARHFFRHTFCVDPNERLNIEQVKLTQLYIDAYDEVRDILPELTGPYTNCRKLNEDIVDRISKAYTGRSHCVIRYLIEEGLKTNGQVMNRFAGIYNTIYHFEFIKPQLDDDKRS
ncbi:uncharacterized protein LOC135825136 [Sycon ciliatum]|uniref:uncharacterized protein LOC135825136 n=1 Tax=Sycon ciliatum TaxID=27933 RepID=UPI0031F70D3C